nr:e3 ubiquitin-protein ligase rha2b [Quercus suber]
MNTQPISKTLQLFSLVLSSMSTFHKQFDKLILASLCYEHDMPEISEELSINLYKRKLGTREEVECAVCLSKIGEGEEIRQLRCDHLFHRVTARHGGYVESYEIAKYDENLFLVRAPTADVGYVPNAKYLAHIPHQTMFSPIYQMV